MYYLELKEIILNMFDRSKLSKKSGEWGFFNEQNKDVNIIAYATNITPEVIILAAEEKADILITHHDSWEFVFGLKEKCNELLIKTNLIHMYFHAPLDDAAFGTSASLANALELKNCSKAIPYEDIYFCAVIGEYENPITFEQLSQQLSSILSEPVRCYENNNKLIHKVCVTTGAGNMTNDMRVAFEQDCDTYITGEYVLYSQQYAKLVGMNLMVGSHTNTEIFGVRSMAELLTKDTKIKLVRIQEPNY